MTLHREPPADSLTAVTIDYPSGTSVRFYESEVTIDTDRNEVSIYREKGNTDVHELHDFWNPRHVSIGRYLRTDYRS